MSRAVTLYTQACDGGDAAGCTNLGSSYYHGTGVMKDPSRAASLYKQAGEGGVGRGGAGLGLV